MRCGLCLDCWPLPRSGGTSCGNSACKCHEERHARERLEYLRGEIRAKRISYGELAELFALAPCIEPGDTELLEWAGVPEFEDNAPCVRYIVRVVSEEAFHGVVTGYVGPFNTSDEAQAYVDDIDAFHHGEAEAYVEELHELKEN